MASRPFRVIIVGAGPTGLAMGNMLRAANIDFIILERYANVVTQSGATIMLWPHATRILDQLGLMDIATRNTLPLHTKTVITHKGRQVSRDPAFRMIEENHGYPALAYPRPQLIKLLYEGLEAHMFKVRTSSSVQDIEVSEDGVMVRLEDGSAEWGSIVIGCDGVHSQTRSILHREATRHGRTMDEHRQTAEFECLFGTATSFPAVPSGIFWESHGPGIASQFASDGSTCRFSIWRCLEKSRTEKKYNCAENDKTADFLLRMGEAHLAPGLQAQDLEKHCTWQRLVYQPESLLEEWYHGRIVLCGESVAQMTSINGMGFNVAFQSAAILANKLCALLRSNGNPNKGTLEKTFAQYQDIRKPETKAVTQISLHYVRAATWSSRLGKIFIDYILPLFYGEAGLLKMLGEKISKGRKLDFIHHEDKMGKMPWGE